MVTVMEKEDVAMIAFIILTAAIAMACGLLFVYDKL
jgi:hypothetical protein